MELKKSIGQKTLLLLVINAILGTGIFFLPAIGALYSGAGSIISWIIMSFIAVLISLYFAELVSMFPKAGGVYEFIKNAFGKSTAFVFGWMSWIVSNITIAMLIVGSIFYIFPETEIVFKIIMALVFILVFNFINYRGIDWASRMLLFFGVMTVATILALIIPGVHTVNTANFSLAFSVPIPFILLTVYFIAETFFGWETTTYLSEEIKNSRKVLPKMLVIGTVIIAILSVLLIFVALGNIEPSIFAIQEAPLAFLAENLFGSGIGKIFAIIIFIPLIGTAASWIVSSPRLLYAISRDKMLVPIFSKIHKKYRTPYIAIIFQTIVTSMITIIAFGSYIFLLSLLIPLVVIMYSFVMLSVVKLRFERPKEKRYFNAPFPRAGPVVVVLFNLAILYMWLTQVDGAVYVFLMGLFLIILGIPLYIIIKLQTDQRFTERFYDRIAFFWDRTFRIWYTEKETEKILKHLRLKNDHVVLDFGCGSGNTTIAVSQIVKDGTVVAVDLSQKQLEHAVKKVKKLKLTNVIFVKGSIKIPRKSFHAVTAVGVLEHLNEPHRYITRLMDSLKKGGRFYFISFGKSFGIPGPEFLESDEKIKKLFGRNVEIHISRKKKRFVEYVNIYGVKK
ncbi:MAG TPA: amino acid permease [archaeon]|nr:amino acid permease [archaeon]